MELRNYTPFAPLFFPAQDTAGTEFGVLVVRGTFRIEPGAPLLPVPDQAAVLTADVHRGDPATTSVRAESDLAPLKPRADVVLDAVAHAPDGQPASDWLVRVAVGKTVDGELRQAEHLLRVTGPRQWRHGVTGWALSDPEPAVRVPLAYELAYGGVAEGGGAAVPYAQNPVGRGYFLPKYAARRRPVPGPQIEDPREPVVKAGAAYAPQGVGPLGRGWQPRVALAGTFDETWRETRWPGLPEDFDFAHYNGAPAPLQIDGYLDGDETVALLGLHADQPELAFCLPGYRLATLARYRDGTIQAAPPRLDTLALDLASDDPAEHRATLVWRTVFSLRKPLRVLEARMELPETPPAVDPALLVGAPAPA